MKVRRSRKSRLPRNANLLRKSKLTRRKVKEKRSYWNLVFFALAHLQCGLGSTEPKRHSFKSLITLLPVVMANSKSEFVLSDTGIIKRHRDFQSLILQMMSRQFVISSTKFKQWEGQTRQRMWLAASENVSIKNGRQDLKDKFFIFLMLHAMENNITTTMMTTQKVIRTDL